MSVYFIQAGSHGPVKIGTSKDPLARLRDLQVSHSEQLRLLGVMPGNYKKEAEVHSIFRHLRLKGEWFQGVQEIIEFAQYGGPIPRLPASLTGLYLNDPAYQGRVKPHASTISPVVVLTPHAVAKIAGSRK